MNLLQTLLKTYDAALEQEIVDNLADSTRPTILPLYHSSRRTINEGDIIQITIDEKGEFLHGSLLPKNEYIIFPVSEASLVRTSKPCPHPLCDEFSYLAEPNCQEPDKKKKAVLLDKHTLYLKELEQLKKYTAEEPNSDFSAIYKYITCGNIRKDIFSTIKDNMNGSEFVLENDEITWKKLENKKEKSKKMVLAKIFITFVVEHAEKAISVSKNKKLHQFYINYVQEKTSEKKEQCDITGKLLHCSVCQRGVIGNAKLIGVSNHTENYIGKQFTDGGQIFHIGYETSQKIHNMLKYLLDKKDYNYYLGSNTYVVSWMTDALDYGGAPLLYEKDTSSEEDESYGPALSDSIDTESDKAEETLGTLKSNNIVKYFVGINSIGKITEDNRFCVLILEKVNNGRMAVKYFRTFICSDVQQRVKNWYESMQWPRWSKQEQKIVLKTPNVTKVVNFLYGIENDKGFVCPKQNDKVRRNALERVVPCILEGKRLPSDMKCSAFYKLQNRASYKKQWRQALQLGCTIIKKYESDHGRQVLNKKGEMAQMHNRSFAYGMLLAVYDKLENDALETKKKFVDSTAKKTGEAHVTNAARFWSAMIHRPLKTAAVLENRTKYYQNALAKNNIAAKIYYDKIRQNIYNEIAKFETDETIKSRPANEDFVLGYYYQQQELYKKKDNGNK